MAALAYVCQNCGGVQAKWSGRCDSCGAWNTLVEETAAAPLPGAKTSAPTAAGKSGKRRKALEFSSLDSDVPPPPRMPTQIEEFDRVLGGGVTPGAAILVGGEPGIGKSTLLLQAAASLARGGARVAYVSGEEAADQIRGRAKRLALADAPVKLASETALESILRGLKTEAIDVAVVDSVQTLWSEQIPAAPGSVAQVRACAQELVRHAKTEGGAVILVGHVTKDGQIAGPRVVEHVVDTVLHFEGDRTRQFRILRGLKNRFGPTDEIGVFTMTGAGLEEVANPSALFLDGRRGAGGPAPGSVVFAGMEGVRPVLVEIQALVCEAAFGTPRRAVVGWEPARLAMVLAVLEARAGLSFAGRDVYLNIAGGLKVTEPAADLAVATALISAMRDAPAAADAAVFGEISLSGDVRAAPRADARIKEAAKLGFAAVLTPAGVADGDQGVTVRTVGTVGDLAARIEADGAAETG